LVVDCAPQLPEVGGDPTKVKDDFRLDPIDKVDAIGKKHDLAYQKLKLEGLKGVMANSSSDANNEAARTADDVLISGKDEITKKEVTKTERVGAGLISIGFKLAEVVKLPIYGPFNLAESGVKAVDAAVDAVKNVKDETIKGVSDLNNWSPH
jgi:hypothetical protein